MYVLHFQVLVIGLYPGQSTERGGLNAALLSHFVHFSNLLQIYLFQGLKLFNYLLLQAQEIIATHRSSGLAAIQMGDDSYNQLDGNAIGWMSVEGSREIVPPVLTADLLPSPLGPGEAMDLDHDMMTESSKRAASTQGEPSNPRTPQTATKRSVRNRARQGKAAEQTGSLRRSSRQAKNRANKD